jgi:hypothetical protein
MKLKVYLTIFIFKTIFLSACQEKKTDNKKVQQKNHSKNIIKFQPEKDWKIYTYGIGFVELGNSLNHTISELKKEFNCKKEMFNIYNIYKNGEKVLYLVGNESTNKIEFIRVFKNNWQSESGLKIGMSVKEINKFHKNFYMEYDVSSGSEYFPEDGSFYKSKKEYKSFIQFHFKGIPFEYIGKYDFNNTKKTIFTSKNNYEKATIFLIDIKIIQ